MNSIQTTIQSAVGSAVFDGRGFPHRASKIGLDDHQTSRLGIDDHQTSRLGIDDHQTSRLGIDDQIKSSTNLNFFNSPGNVKR